MVLDKLYASKQEIEKDFGTELSWQRLEGKKSCRVAARLEDVNVQKKEIASTLLSDAILSTSIV